MQRARSIPLLAALLLAFPAAPALAEPLLGEVVQAGRYVFYRDSAQAHGYYYVPPEPRLALGSRGRPEFLFIKYTRAGVETTPQTRGGLVHFLVTWGFTEGELRSARQALGRVDGAGKILGPLPFKHGRFAVVSASAGEDGIFTRRIVGEGQAPILPGTKAAASIALSPEGATVLWESFQRETSEVSVVFALTFAGLTPAYRARLEVDWDKVYTHHDVQADLQAQIKVVKVGAEIRSTFDKMRESGAIKLEVEGESASMKSILDVAYAHILKQMFEPVLDNLDGTPPLTPRSPLGELRKTLSHLPPGLVPALWYGSAPPLRRVADEDLFTLPIEEPYAFPEDAPSGVGELLRAAELLSQEDQQFAEAREIYERMYERLPMERSILAARAADVSATFELSGGFSHSVLWRHLSWAYVAESDDPSLREGIRENFREVRERARGAALPPATKRLTGEPEATLKRFGSALAETRRRHAEGELLGTVQAADEALAAISYLSEPHLWKARALDRMNEIGAAIDAYEAYLTRRISGEGRTDNAAVERRLAELKTRRLEMARAGAGGGPAGGGAGIAAGATGAKETGEAAGSGAGEAAAEGTLKGKAKDEEKAKEETKAKDKGKDQGEGGSKGKDGQEEGGSDLSPFSVRVGYQYRQVRKTGRYEVDLRQRLREEREVPLAGNIGGFVRGDGSRYLLEVDLDDPSFQERPVEVLLDGQDHEDFQRYVNAVSVQLRRVHANGRQLEESVVFTREHFGAQGNRQRWVYPRLGDPPGRWFDYAYKVRWDFFGGASWETGAWEATDRDVITLAAPAVRREVVVNVKAEDFVVHDVEAVEVEFENELFGRRRQGSLVMTMGEPLSQTYTYVTAADDGAYRFRTKWVHGDGTERVTPWQERSSSYLLARHP
jgi:hypothetical protein